jgi:hypothetical protein
MKKLISVSALLLFAGIFTASAQEESTVKKDAKKVGNKTKKEAKMVGNEAKKDATKAGNKTAEVASKAEARVVDKVYSEKTGPNGETIYIDKHSRYYWIDKKGHHHYIKEAMLKNKQ